MTRRRILFAVVLASISVLGTGYAMRERLLPAAARWLDVGEPPTRADYAIVLAGNVQSRPFAAASLYKHGYVRRLVLTRAPSQEGPSHVEPAEHELATRVLTALGVKEQDIRVLEPPVLSTFDEAQACAPQIRAEPNARFVIVTNDFHMRRAMWIFRRTVPEAIDRLHALSVPSDDFTADDWWRDVGGFDTYLREYCRLLFYYLRYDRRVQTVVAICLAAVLVIAVVRRRRGRIMP